MASEAWAVGHVVPDQNGRRTGRDHRVILGYFDGAPDLVTMAMNERQIAARRSGAARWLRASRPDGFGRRPCLSASLGSCGTDRPASSGGMPQGHFQRTGASEANP
jgi:hypothetical protein